MATNTGRPRWALRTSAALTLGFLGSVAGTSAQAAPPAATTPPGDEIAHTVQEGDTLEGLAKAYLAALNKLIARGGRLHAQAAE